MATVIFDHAHPNILQSTFNFNELVSTGKNMTFSFFSSRDIVALKILQFDWSRAIWFISQKKHYPQMWDLCMNTSNDITDQILEKKLWQNFQLIHKTLFLAHFWHFFPIFEAKILFSKIRLSHTTPHGPLTPYWVQEKSKELIAKKLPDERTDS